MIMSQYITDSEGSFRCCLYGTLYCVGIEESPLNDFSVVSNWHHLMLFFVL
jgi:hypothetical protein